jgi:hypothetical protein
MNSPSRDCTSRTDDTRRCPVGCIANHRRLVVKNRRGMGQATICDLCQRLMTQREWFDALFGGER